MKLSKKIQVFQQDINYQLSKMSINNYKCDTQKVSDSTKTTRVAKNSFKTTKNILHLMTNYPGINRYYSNDNEKCPDSVRSTLKDKFPYTNYGVDNDF